MWLPMTSHGALLLCPPPNPPPVPLGLLPVWLVVVIFKLPEALPNEPQGFPAKLTDPPDCLPNAPPVFVVMADSSVVSATITPKALFIDPLETPPTDRLAVSPMDPQAAPTTDPLDEPPANLPQA